LRQLSLDRRLDYPWVRSNKVASALQTRSREEREETG